MCHIFKFIETVYINNKLKHHLFVCKCKECYVSFFCNSFFWCECYFVCIFVNHNCRQIFIFFICNCEFVNNCLCSVWIYVKVWNKYHFTRPSINIISKHSVVCCQSFTSCCDCECVVWALIDFECVIKAGIHNFAIFAYIFLFNNNIIFLCVVCHCDFKNVSINFARNICIVKISFTSININFWNCISWFKWVFLYCIEFVCFKLNKFDFLSCILVKIICFVFIECCCKHNIFWRVFIIIFICFKYIYYIKFFCFTCLFIICLSAYKFCCKTRNSNFKSFLSSSICVSIKHLSKVNSVFVFSWVIFISLCHISRNCIEIFIIFCIRIICLSLFNVCNNFNSVEAVICHTACYIRICHFQNNVNFFIRLCNICKFDRPVFSVVLQCCNTIFISLCQINNWNCWVV